MGSIQRKTTNFVGISCLVLVVLAQGFHPLQASVLPGCPKKITWPELVGVPGCEAAATIKKENPTLNPIVLPEGTAVPLTYVCTRVYVPIKGHLGLVSDTPFAV